MTEPYLQTSEMNEAPEEEQFSYVNSTARIALYDDLRSAPRITEIGPNETDLYIMNIATQTYEQAKLAGGHIPFTIIKEVSENFIHARFTEIIVSILDEGNTIRFADQGPGIADKEKAQRPGFSSAVQAMKPYIRGVGSGLPIVKDYFDESHGTVTIEDNIKTGAVVTISLNEKATQRAPEQQKQDERMPQPSSTRPQSAYIPPLNERERTFLKLFLSEGDMGITELVKLTGVANSSTFATVKKLEEYGLVQRTLNKKKRGLTEFGFNVAKSL